MTQPDAGGVLIKLEDIYRMLVALTSRVDSALSQHEQVRQVVAEHEVQLRPLAGTAERLTDHEGRLRQLERSRWPLPSIAALVSIGSLVVAVLALVYRK